MSYDQIHVGDDIYYNPCAATVSGPLKHPGGPRSVVVGCSVEIPKGWIRIGDEGEWLQRMNNGEFIA